MIKQLRKRFILVMMLSLVIVFALLIAAINIVYSYNERKSIDARLEMIYNNGGSFPDGKQMRDGAQAEGEPRPKDSLDAGEPSNAAAPGEDEHSGTLAPPSPRIPALKQAFSLSPSTRTDPLQILTIIIPLPLRKTRFGSMLRRSSPATTNTEHRNVPLSGLWKSGRNLFYRCHQLLPADTPGKAPAAWLPQRRCRCRSAGVYPGASHESARNPACGGKRAQAAPVHYERGA